MFFAATIRDAWQCTELPVDYMISMNKVAYYKFPIR
jgi:hypothetical protein